MQDSCEFFSIRSPSKNTSVRVPDMIASWNGSLTGYIFICVILIIWPPNRWALVAHAGSALASVAPLEQEEGGKGRERAWGSCRRCAGECFRSDRAPPHGSHVWPTGAKGKKGILHLSYANIEHDTPAERGVLVPVGRGNRSLMSNRD
jgi:hypothetical protein